MGGWGLMGTMRTKILPCSMIDAKFLYHAGPTGDYTWNAAYVRSGQTKLFSDEVAEEWARICGIPVGDTPDPCSQSLLQQIMALPSMTAPSPSPPPPVNADLWPPPAEQCMASALYRDSNMRCAAGLMEVWGDDTVQKMYQTTLSEGMSGCGQRFCASLSYVPSGTTAGQDSNGFINCFDPQMRPVSVPATCQQAAEYMLALKDAVSCRIRVYAAGNAVRVSALANTTRVNPNQDMEACEAVDTCERSTHAAATSDWGVEYCVNFIKALKASVPDMATGLEACGYTGDGTKGTSLMTKCTELISGQSASSSTPMTCGDVKSAYKTQGCCGSPSKKFTWTRRLADDQQAEGQLLSQIEAALGAAMSTKGKEAASELANKIKEAMRGQLPEQA